MIYNSFGDSLKRLERKLKIIGSTIENVRAFFDCGNTYNISRFLYLALYYLD